MTRLRNILAVTVIALSAAGCNSLLFYETGKFSLTIEGRPDSSQPVQGSLGFKQRTAVVSPPMTSGTDHTDSASMISSFLFDKQPGWGPVTVRTALVTGDASKLISVTDKQRVAQAVAGVAIDSYDVSADRGVAKAVQEGKLDRLRQLAAKPYQDLTESEKDELGALTGSGGGNYSEGFHDALRKKLGR